MKRFSITTWFIVFLFLIIAIGFLVYIYCPEKEIPEEKIKEGGTTEETKEDIATDNEMTDWGTYRDEEYGFEVKYPENFTIKETFTLPEKIGPPPPEYLEQFEYLDPVRIVKTFEISSPEEKIEIDVFRNANNLSIDQWSDYVGNPELGYEGFIGGIRNSKQISVNGITGIKGSFGCCGGCFAGVFIPRNNFVYSLNISGSGFASEPCPSDYVKAMGTSCCIKVKNESIYNQILSTFKFL